MAQKIHSTNPPDNINTMTEKAIADSATVERMRWRNMLRMASEKISMCGRKIWSDDRERNDRLADLEMIIPDGIHQRPSVSSTRKRVLFFAEAVTLAHVARVHALAQLLDPRHYEVAIASDPRYDSLIGPHRFGTYAIQTISTARFSTAIERGSPIYDAETLADYVAEDSRVIAAFAPDIVVGDFRLSLSISARLAAKPYVNITNAGWSPFSKTPFIVPEIPIARWLGVPVAQGLFDMTRSIAFAAHARPLNIVRRRFGLPALSSDLRVTYTDADQVLYADLPMLFPMRPLPPTHRFLGAVLWSPESALPSWWNTLPTDRPVVYVTLGSSGNSGLLATIVEALGTLPITVVAATAGRVRLDRVPGNAFVADYVPGTAAAALSSLVICNGGSPTSYQALSAGVPVLGLPGNLDQFLNMTAVETFGAGVLMRPQRVSQASIAGATEALLRDDSRRQAASRLRDTIASFSQTVILDEALTHAMH